MSATTTTRKNATGAVEPFRVHFIGGVNYPVSKLAYGDADSAITVEDAAPFPVKGKLWTGTGWVDAAGDVANGQDVDVTRVPSQMTVIPRLADGVGGYSDESGNTEFTILTSAARTALATSANIPNPNLRGLVVFLDVTAVGGTGGLTLEVRGIDPLTTKQVNLLSASTPVTATGTYLYVVSPGASVPAGANVIQASALPLPRTVRVRVNPADASSYTYSVSGALVR